MRSLLSCALLASFIYIATSDDVILQKRYAEEEERPMPDDVPVKRPFCNAFTGCGRKRSAETMATLVDMNSEPAVEDLSRQILSEAKLWEAIQEARLELRRRHQQGGGAPIPLAGLRKRSARYLHT